MCDKITNEAIEIFEALNDAKKWIRENTKYSGDIGTITDAIKKNRVSYGYKWIELSK